MSDHSAESAKKDTTEAIDFQKWVQFMEPTFVLLLLCFRYFFYSGSYTPETSPLIQSSISENSFETIVVSKLHLNEDEIVMKVTKPTRIRFDVPGYQFDVDGEAKIDDACIIKDRKVIKGNIPDSKEYYLITPIKNTFLTFKKQ